MIEFRDVHKTYRVIPSRPGLGATIRNLFAPRYGYVKALQGVSFGIGEGELVGLIGENGAGKSTLVKIATGILRPSSGTVLLEGKSVQDNRKACALRFGVAFGQRRALWWQLSARESLQALGRIYRVPSSQIAGRIEQLIEVFELERFVDMPVRQMSLGQRIRCEVAGALVHRPRIVYLDEPTIGMDVLAKIKMREYLKRINREDGVSVLLTSHDLFDVERLCERALILDSGRLILDETFDALREKFCGNRVLRLNLASPIDDGRLDGMDGVEVMPGEDRWRLKILFDPVKTPVMGLITDLRQRLDIVDFMVEDLPIDEFVAEIYRTREREG